MSFSDELLGFWSKPKRRVFIAQWEQGFRERVRSYFHFYKTKGKHTDTAKIK